MKLSLSLLATATFCAPEGKKRQKSESERSFTRPPPVPCSTEVSDSWLTSGGSPFKFVDNGQSGQVTFESYERNANCYVDIGSSCGTIGLQVKINHMELETYTDISYEDGVYVYEYSSCYDTTYFEWVNMDGKIEKTDGQCGCLGEDHPSCDDHPFDYDEYIAVTEKPTQYNLVGTDVKIVLQSDSVIQGGKIEIDWKCNNPIKTSAASKPVIDTLEMAEALLIGSLRLSPSQGEN